jgi:lysophospholipase L1-like esterase
MELPSQVSNSFRQCTLCHGFAEDFPSQLRDGFALHRRPLLESFVELLIRVDGQRQSRAHENSVLRPGTMPCVRRITLALPLLSFLLAGCRPDIPNLDSRGHTIVCLGDSITAGTGAEPGPAYPELLNRRLGTEVINQGVPGDTAEAGLARVDQALAADPWLVIVELGGNDILNRIPPERTEAALRQVLERLLAARVAVLLVELDVPFAGRYAEIYERLGDDYDVPVLDDTLGDILTDARLKADPIHPNAQGHEVLAADLAEEIEPFLKARREMGR